MIHKTWKISALFAFCLAGSIFGIQSCSDQAPKLRSIASEAPAR